MNSMLQYSWAYPEKHSDLCQRWAASFGDGSPACETIFCHGCELNHVSIGFWTERLNAVDDVRVALQRAAMEMK